MNCAPRFALRLTNFINIAGVDGCASEGFLVGVDGGEFDVKHLDEGFDGLLLVAVGVGKLDLRALAV